MAQILEFVHPQKRIQKLIHEEKMRLMAIEARLEEVWALSKPRKVRRNKRGKILCVTARER